MEDNKKEHEIHLESHLIIVISYTCLSLFLIIETLVLKWEAWFILPTVIGILAAWVCHIGQFLNERLRFYFYTGLMLVEIFFYGVHPTSINELPLMFLFVFGLFSLNDEKAVINIAAAEYYMILIYYLFFTEEFSYRTSPIGISRMALDILSVLVMALISKYKIRRRAEERKNYYDIIGQLDEANKRSEDFLTNVSHELRTPINAVMGITSVLLRNEDDPAKIRSLRSIDMGGRRLFGQISDILDYTEIDTGRLVISEEVYMPASLINDLATEYRLRELHGGELILDIDPKVPAKLNGDGAKIKKILWHLIDNAVKFTKEGGVYVRIKALPKEYGVNICINVTDTGIGMDENETEQITDSFYQIDASRSRRAGGMGLGLSNVYGFVTAMGGFMRLEAEKDKGTSVYISIPQKVVDASPCMAVDDASRLCVAVYLKPEKYKVPAIRDFYDEVIHNLSAGLGLPVHRATTKEELEKILDIYKVTHVYIGQEEYEADSVFFESVDRRVKIAVSADQDFSLKSHSNIKLLLKPFCSFHVLNMLQDNVTAEQEQDEYSTEYHMITPGLKALVVDDDEMNLMVAEGFLKDYRMEVTTAPGGEEALELCREHHYDIIFMDHMMPVMDGIEAAHRIRKISSQSMEALLIIALTANAVSGAREMFLQEGFDEFVPKPIETVTFERVLKRILPPERIQYILKGTSRLSDSLDGADENELTNLAESGINVVGGMGYCSGDKAFYLELIEKFAHDAPQKRKELCDFFAERDWHDYRIRVHALKSTSRTVGADLLSEAAADLEGAAKEENASYILGHHDTMIALYDKAVSVISDALSLSSSTEEIELADISAEELMEHLKRIAESLELFDADQAESELEELRAFRYDDRPVDQILSDIREKIGDFELKQASDMVTDLIEQLEKGGEES
ncbi:MAG: response regulator [Lachnospiraceae bacterium]|nr:response regulator [Lachnospiraceae bacterium]